METPANPPDQAPDIETIRSELRTLRALLGSNSISHFASVGFYYLMEWLMYGMVILCLVAAIAIPSDPLSYSQSIDEKTDLSATLHHEDITALMYLIRFFVVFLALFPLGLAIVSRKLRKKNQKLRLAFEAVERMRRVV